MPDLGTTVEEVELVAWLVKEGDRIKRGDIIAEIKTDKAASELESVAEGVVLKLVAAPGTVAAKGDVLAYVGQPGEALPDLLAVRSDAGSAAGPSAPPTRAAAEGARISPMVRNLAAKLGVDPATLRGTGQGWTITREDVIKASQAAASEAALAEGERLSRSQAAVARAVLKSVREIPHLRIAAAIDMSAVEKIRRECAEAGGKISYDAFFLRAMAAGLQAVPLLAARLDGERVLRPSGIHVAVAIGLENELFLPVIRDVDRKGLAELQREIEAVASEVKSGKLSTEHLSGGCMTLSNLGMYPIESFDAIIFPEHSSILSVGAAQKRPVVAGERVEIRPVAVAKLATDHRLINGRAAAMFLTKVKEVIESGAFT
jgi:pyruvate/2-oxoglutarate dehydrogenase complex dihydrolipoamide acyltransferase (E2) component